MKPGRPSIGSSATTICNCLFTIPSPAAAATACTPTAPTRTREQNQPCRFSLHLSQCTHCKNQNKRKSFHDLTRRTTSEPAEHSLRAPASSPSYEPDTHQQGLAIPYQQCVQCGRDPP